LFDVHVIPSLDTAPVWDPFVDTSSHWDTAANLPLPKVTADHVAFAGRFRWVQVTPMLVLATSDPLALGLAVSGAFAFWQDMIVSTMGKIKARQSTKKSFFIFYFPFF